MTKMKITTILLLIIAIYSLSINAVAQGGPNGFGGVGMSITMLEDRIVVDSVIPDSPAARAGIKSGDQLSQINGEPISGKSLEDVVSKIRGKEGTNVAINLKRDGQDYSLDVNRQFIMQNGMPPGGLVVPINPGPPSGLNQSPQNPTLYFVPLSSQVSKGMVIPINVMLDNPKGNMSDDISLWVKYDPEALILTQQPNGNWMSISPRIVNEWQIDTSFVNVAAGEVYVQIKPIHLGSRLSGGIGFLNFQTTGKRPVTEVMFGFNEPGQGLTTKVNYHRKNILGKGENPKDGTISATIRSFSQSDNQPIP
jgi:membrane-associated protease RseP (regulator of RpoE activity)